MWHPCTKIIVCQLLEFCKIFEFRAGLHQLHREAAFTPPPRILAPQISICAFAAGVLTGGCVLKNQLKKVAFGVDATCLASDNSGSETNVQGATSFAKSSNSSFVITRNHAFFSGEVV